MSLKRRHFLMFLGVSAGTMALNPLGFPSRSQNGSGLGIQSAMAATENGLIEGNGPCGRDLQQNDGSRLY